MSFNRNFKKFLDLEDFDSESHIIIKEYICPLCTGVYYNATSDECGHIFCKECIFKYIESSKKCPLSNEQITKESLRPVQFITCLLEKYKIFCKNKIKGCEWVGTTGTLEDHIKDECLQEVIKCVNEDCKIYTLRENLEEHLKICEFKKIKCPNNCEAVLSKSSINLHIDECPKEKVLCPQNCEDYFYREDTDKHLRICKNTLIECHFYPIGCEVKVTGMNKSEHLNTHVSKHLNLLYEKYISLNNKMILLENSSGVEEKKIPKEIEYIEEDKNSDSAHEEEIKKDKKVKKQIVYSEEESIEKDSLSRKRGRGRPPKKRLEISNSQQTKISDFKYIYNHKSFSFDLINTSKEISIYEKTAKVESILKNKHIFLFTQEPVIEGSSWIIKIDKINGWIGFGLCNKEEFLISDNIVKLKSLPHYFYLLSSNGYSWHSTNENENDNFVDDNFINIKEGTEIKMGYTLGGILKFTVGSKNYFLNDVINDNDSQLYPCVLFLNSIGDQVTFK